MVGNDIGLQPFVEPNPRSFDSPIPSIHCLAASLKLSRAKNTAVKRVCFIDKKGHQCGTTELDGFGGGRSLTMLSSGKSWFRVAGSMDSAVVATAAPKE